MRPILLVVGLCISVLGCKTKEDHDNGTYLLYKEHLIDAYICVNSISISQIGNTIFQINCSGPIYSIISQDQTAKSTFQELAIKHNDTFNQKAVVDFGYKVGDNISYAENFVQIDIYSDTTWDDKHKTGDSLNDLCYFTALTYAPALDGRFSYGMVGEIKKRVNELTTSDLRLLKSGTIQLQFPDVEYLPPQTLTIVLKTETEQIFTVNYKI